VIKGWKFAGWEGGLAPAQDRMPFNIEIHNSARKVAFKKGLPCPSPNGLTLNCQFETEWHSILSGGKPTFPTCEFLTVEWCLDRLQFFHSIFPGWDF